MECIKKYHVALCISKNLPHAGSQVIMKTFLFFVLFYALCIHLRLYNFISKLGRVHVGKYKCYSIQDSNKVIYYFVYANAIL